MRDTGGMMLQERIDNLIRQIKESIVNNPPSDFVTVNVDKDVWVKIIKHPAVIEAYNKSKDVVDKEDV